MAGRIKADDIALVKERSSIEDVVREHVTLRPAGPGSLKGLCPFHDEKTPSFNIRPAVGAWHCFGCGEGGDVISFLQKVEHLTFAEAVERLAQRLGMELQYEEGGRPREGESLGRRSRLIEAHRAAQEFYHRALLESPEARIGRDFLRERGFDGEAAKRFGVGFAPRGGEELSRYLRSKGFSDDEPHRRRSVGAGEPWALRPLPRPARVAHPRHHRRHRRFRRPTALRRRPDRRQVPQHVRDPDLQEVDRPLWPRRRQEGDRIRAQGRRRRGLHRRDGLPPGRHRGRGRHVRHGLRHRPHQGAPPDHAGRGRPRARACGLHLRRGRSGTEGRDARLRGGPALGVAVLRGRGRAGDGPV